MNDPNQLKIVKGLEALQKAQKALADKNYAEAAKLFNKALALMPNNPMVLLEFSKLTMEIKDWAASEQIYRKIGELRPKSNWEGYLAEALFRQEKFAEAIPHFRKHLERYPDNSDVMHALSNSLCSLGYWDEGLEMARRAWDKEPKAKYMDSILNALFHMSRYDELEQLAPKALARFPNDPGVRSMYALHKLKYGDLAEGFKYFMDFRWRNNINTRADGGTPGEWWDGKPFDGTLLCTAEQGLGDELMASSIFEDLVAMGQKAVIECDLRLVPVYSRSFPALRFVPRGGRILKQIHDEGGDTFRKINVLDLATMFRAAPDSFPARKAWLQADPERTRTFRERYQSMWPGRKLVGISWKSSRVMEGGAQKGTTLAQFAPVLAVPGARFVNLQYGDVAAEIDAAREAGLGEVYMDTDLDTTKDIDSLFAQVAALDLVVSTSNTTVHVAGALGKPCLLLLPKIRPALWYWGYRGDRTPWYPSIEILRNPHEESWDELMETVATRVAGFQPEGHG